MSEPPQPDPIPLAKRAVLPYRAISPVGAVTLRRFYDVMEAQLYANELTAHGIDYHLLNQNANALGPYSAFSQVELQVRPDDAAAAAELLERLQLDPSEVEPEYPDPAGPIPDPAGAGILVRVAAYGNPRQLFDAAAELGAACIDSFVPALVARGDRPMGSGARFVIRVREADLEAARQVLKQEAAAKPDEPRCPSCGSWRVYTHPPRQGLFDFLRGRVPGQPPRMECLRCHYQWQTSPAIGR